MQRTEISEFNGRIYLRRELKVGEVWMPIWMIKAGTLEDGIKRFPRAWRGRQENEIRVIAGGAHAQP